MINHNIQSSIRPSICCICVTQTRCLVRSSAWGTTNTSLSRSALADEFGDLIPTWTFYSKFLSHTCGDARNTLQTKPKGAFEVFGCRWGLKFCRPDCGDWQEQLALHLAFGADGNQMYCRICARRLDGPCADVAFSCFLCM